MRADAQIMQASYLIDRLIHYLSKWSTRLGAKASENKILEQLWRSLPAVVGQDLSSLVDANTDVSNHFLPFTMTELCKSPRGMCKKWFPG